MALTLPYPGLVFVPLDILTAEEQNEIVANYTYIANQFPITAENINFSSFHNAYYERESGYDLTTSEVAIVSHTFTSSDAGTYVVISWTQPNFNNTQNEIISRILKNSTQVGGQSVAGSDSGEWVAQQMTCIGQATFTAGDEVKLIVKKTYANPASVAGHASLTLIRIG